MSTYDTITARMDDRHWWLVSKLQETFEGHLTSTHLEDFLCHPDTEPALTGFLTGTSPKSLFFCSKYDTAGGRVLVRVFSFSMQLRPSKLAYFTRRNRGDTIHVDSYSQCEGPDVGMKEVPRENFGDHIVWGEMDSTVLADLRNMINEVCLPLVSSCENGEHKWYKSFLH